MINKIVKLILVTLLFGSITLGSKHVFADSISKQTGYSISPIFSENQTTDIDSFYDIKWTPNNNEKFSLKITNNTDSTKNYSVEVNKARTNSNAAVDYTDTTKENQSAPYKLTQMINLPSEVKVPAHSSEIVPGNLVFPEEDFNGILMAGIHVSEKKSVDKQTPLSNTVSYNIPFVVRGNVDKRPDPRIDLQKLMLKKSTIETYSLNVFLNNKRPNLLKSVKVKAEITDENGKILVTDSKKLDITPETEFAYPVALPASTKAGKYTLTLSMQHGSEHHWKFTREFSISKQDQKNIKEAAPNKIDSKLLYSGVIIIISVLMGAIVYKRRQNTNK